MSTATRLIRSTVRLCILLALIAWLLKDLDYVDVLHALQSALQSPLRCVMALVLTCLALLCGSLRWHAVLHQLGYTHVNLPSAIRWVWIGQFFNAFLPGACGGDLVRAWEVTRGCQRGERAEAASSVLIDRLIGLWVLILWSGGVLLVNRSRFQEQVPWTVALNILLLLSLGAILAPLFVFRLPATVSGKIHSLAGRVHQAFQGSLRSPRTILVTCLGSLGNMVFLTLAAYVFATSVGSTISVSNMFILFPVITVLSSIPLTPGALGIRENLLATLGPLFLLDAEPAVALSLLVYLSGLVVGAVGGVFFVLDRKGTEQGFRESLQQIKVESESV